MARAIAAALLEESGVWVDSLDRSVLGVFANSREKLVAFDALERWGADRSRPKSIYLKVNGILHDSLLTAANNTPENSSKDCRVLVIGELRYWQLEGKPNGYRNNMDTRIGDGLTNIAKTLDMLHVIADNPDMHDYFVADVWDVVLIAQCISENIDPEMTRDMYLA